MFNFENEINPLIFEEVINGGKFILRRNNDGRYLVTLENNKGIGVSNVFSIQKLEELLLGDIPEMSDTDLTESATFDVLRSQLKGQGIQQLCKKLMRVDWEFVEENGKTYAEIAGPVSEPAKEPESN